MPFKNTLTRASNNQFSTRPPAVHCKNAWVSPRVSFISSPKLKSGVAQCCYLSIRTASDKRSHNSHGAASRLASSWCRSTIALWLRHLRLYDRSIGTYLGPSCARGNRSRVSHLIPSRTSPTSDCPKDRSLQKHSRVSRSRTEK